MDSCESSVHLTFGMNEATRRIQCGPRDSALAVNNLCKDMDEGYTRALNDKSASVADHFDVSLPKSEVFSCIAEASLELLA